MITAGGMAMQPIWVQADWVEADDPDGLSWFDGERNQYRKRIWVGA